MPDMFVLNIMLGNAAMQTPEDVAVALRELAVRLEGCVWGDSSERIRDANGNTVGMWTAA